MFVFSGVRLSQHPMTGGMKSTEEVVQRYLTKHFASDKTMARVLQWNLWLIATQASALFLLRNCGLV
jgi:hypothetical protein